MFGEIKEHFLAKKPDEKWITLLIQEVRHIVDKKRGSLAPNEISAETLQQNFDSTRLFAGIGGSISAICIVFLSVLIAFSKLDVPLNFALILLALAIPMSAFAVLWGFVLGLNGVRISNGASNSVMSSAALSTLFLILAIGFVLGHLEWWFLIPYALGIIWAIIRFVFSLIEQDRIRRSSSNTDRESSKN